MRVFILLLPLTFITSSVSAQPLAVTNTFSNTTVADADQVNQNFADVEDWVNAHIKVKPFDLSVGLYSMEYTITPTYNTSIGNYALNSNTSGQSNTAVGQSALGANTEGSDNTALG